MSQPIEAFQQPGLNLYVVIHYNGQVWNTNSLAFENYNQAHWADYAIGMTEQTGSGYYSATYPAAIPLGILSTEIIYRQVGGSPTLGDPIQGGGQTQGSNAQLISGNGTAAINLAASALGIVPGAAAAGTLSTTQFTSNLSNTVDDAYVGRIAIFTSGTLKGQASIISDYNHTGGKVTVSPPFTTAPSATDTFVIL